MLIDESMRCLLSVPNLVRRLVNISCLRPKLLPRENEAKGPNTPDAGLLDAGPTRCYYEQHASLRSLQHHELLR